MIQSDGSWLKVPFAVKGHMFKLDYAYAPELEIARIQ